MQPRNLVPDLLQRLKEPAYAKTYFATAIDEALKTGDYRLITLAAQDIMDAMSGRQSFTEA